MAIGLRRPIVAIAGPATPPFPGHDAERLRWADAAAGYL